MVRDIGRSKVIPGLRPRTGYSNATVGLGQVDPTLGWHFWIWICPTPICLDDTKPAMAPTAYAKSDWADLSQVDRNNFRRLTAFLIERHARKIQ
jgi:hypothetical protein